MIGHIETDREKRVAQILATDTTREQLADALWCAEDCVRRLVERTSLLNDKSFKLRELVRDLWHLLYDWLFKAHEVPYDELKAVSDRMRELGIEVDDG